MQLQTTKRTKQKLRLALEGDTYTGKTLSSLLLAYGMTGNWSKIAIIDTEQNSACLYSHLGPYNTIQLAAPFTPEKFIEAIRLCEQAQMEVIIIDSISPEWVGENGVLDVYCATTGDALKKYDAILPRHHVFVDAIIYSTAHIIATVRCTKRRVFQQDGYTHYFTSVLRLNIHYEASVIKDRTGLLQSLCPYVLTPAIGCKLYQWCNAEEAVVHQMQENIDNSTLSLSQKVIPIVS